MRDFICSYQGFSVIGLSLDIIGVFFLFFYALPLSGASYAVSEEYLRKKPFRKVMSFIGLILLIIGFALQLISSILSYCQA
ncbi:MAG: hypothetical protein IIB06_01725 [Bacteroidetes bacterium]|nr:hypothetical protein [Bacteroidota bacterium]